MSDAETLLAASDRLLREVVPGTRGVWPRAVVVALRAALELELDAFWSRVGVDVSAVPMRSKLLLLDAYADAGVARQASVLWSSLSRASHHHAYELAPTSSELRTWYGEVLDVRRRLERPRDRSGQSDPRST